MKEKKFDIIYVRCNDKEYATKHVIDEYSHRHTHYIDNVQDGFYEYHKCGSAFIIDGFADGFSFDILDTKLRDLQINVECRCGHDLCHIVYIITDKSLEDVKEEIGNVDRVLMFDLSNKFEEYTFDNYMKSLTVDDDLKYQFTEGFLREYRNHQKYEYCSCQQSENADYFKDDDFNFGEDD